MADYDKRAAEDLASGMFLWLTERTDNTGLSLVAIGKLAAMIIADNENDAMTSRILDTFILGVRTETNELIDRLNEAP